MVRRDLVVVGASAGGVEALRGLVAALPPDFPAAVLIVLHSAPSGPSLLPGILGRAGPLMAVEGQDKMPLQTGRIYVAPPDRHLIVSPGHVHVTQGPRENLSRPAIDPLFRTAARFYGPRVIGVILTGLLNDGTAGLLDVKRRGGVAVVQEPREALYPSMPLSALRYVEVDERLPLRQIGPRLVELTREEVVEIDVPPATPQLAMESKFASMGNLDQVETMHMIGALAPYSCPECHGPLWRMNGEGPLRFRCHVGHAYTAEILELGQGEAMELHLWSLLRTLEERASLLRELSDRARETNHPAEASAWERRIARLQDEMRDVRALLANGKSAPGGPAKRVGA